ncbi:MAG: hypothetical protein ACRC0V_09450 [Fusobacteriaceae bacterium]
MTTKNKMSEVLRYTLGLGLILTGVLGILETSFFTNRAYGVMGIVMLISAMDHIYMIFTKENDYFDWKMVALGTLCELTIAVIILFLNFINKDVIISLAVGVFLSIKGVILIIGNKQTSSEENKGSFVLRGVSFVKGLFLFLVGALMIILPLINGRIAMVFGWYILFLGINFISYPLINYYRNSKKEEIL